MPLTPWPDEDVNAEKGISGWRRQTPLLGSRQTKRFDIEINVTAAAAASLADGNAGKLAPFK